MDLVLAGFITALFCVPVILLLPFGHLKPWNWLIAGLTCTAGLSIYELGILDEIFLCVFAAGLAFVRMPGVPQPDHHPKLLLWHKRLFTILVLYLVFQALRGTIAFEELRKLRWVVFFLLVGWLSVLLNHFWVLRPSSSQVARAVCFSTTAYFLFYSVFGMVFEIFLGVSRFDLQQPGHTNQMLWGTTAYAMFPIVPAIAAMMVCINSPDQRNRKLGWILFVISLAVSFYYESRAALVALVAFWALVTPKIGLRRSLALCLIFGGTVYVLATWTQTLDVETALGDFEKLWDSAVNPSEIQPERTEFERFAHMLVAYEAIRDDPITLLFGHGYRMSGSVIGTPLLTILRRYSPETIGRMKNTDFSDVGTEAFTGWIVDTGVVGFLLLLSVHVLVILRANALARRERLAITTAVLLSLFWLPIIDFRDIVLWYFMFMPNGLLIALAQPPEYQQR